MKTKAESVTVKTVGRPNRAKIEETLIRLLYDQYGYDVVFTPKPENRQKEVPA